MRIPSWWRWSVTALGHVVLIFLAVLYVDRPLARAMAAHGTFHQALAKAPVEFPAMLILAIIAILIALGHFWLRKPLSRWATAGFLAGLASSWSFALIEYGLKFLFGRTLPNAYLRDGQYGFHWFHAGNKFGAFPSGHADQAAAILSVLWIFYPRWRWVYVAAMVVLSCALVAGQWHFLSDIIAGGYVGAAAGAVTVMIWNLLSRDSRAGAKINQTDGLDR